MGLRMLIASKGKVLTNGEACGKIIHLGTNDSESNWYEITEEEYLERTATKEEKTIV